MKRYRVGKLGRNVLAPRREFALDSVPWLLAPGLYEGVRVRGVTVSMEAASSLFSRGVLLSLLLAVFFNLDSSTGRRDVRLLGSDPELFAGDGVNVSTSGLTILEMALSSPGVYLSMELRQDMDRIGAAWASPSAVWASVHAWAASLLPRKICAQKKSSPSPFSKDCGVRLVASTLKWGRKCACWGFSEHLTGLEQKWANVWPSGWSPRPSLSRSASAMSTVEI